MALSGQVQTYLERTVDGTLWLPSDAQRLLTQLRDLDGRAEELRAICERKADELLEQPTGNGRGSTMEHSDAIASERSLLERDQRELLFCQAEKVEVANQLVNLVAGHAKRLDTDLEEFAAELSAAGEDPNDMLAGGLPSPYPTAGSPFPLMSQPSGGSMGLSPAMSNGSQLELDDLPTPAVKSPKQAGPRAARRPGEWNPGQVGRPPKNARMAPSPLGEPEQPTAAPTPRPGPGLPRNNPLPSPVVQTGLQMGDQVAACILAPTEEDPQALEWIMATFARAHAPLREGGPARFEVRDEEASEGEVGAHLLPQSRVIALPKGPQCPILPPGSPVLAVYPGTTTFYRATVVTPARRHKSGDHGDYLLEFEDDGDASGMPQRSVHFRHVVAFPAAYM